MKRFMCTGGERAVYYVGRCDCEIALERNLIDDLEKDGYSVEYQDIDLGAVEDDCVVIALPFGGEDLDVVWIIHATRKAIVTRYRVCH